MDETQRLYSVTILDALERKLTTRQEIVGFTCAVTRRKLSRIHFDSAYDWLQENELIRGVEITAKGAGYLMAWEA